MGHFHQKSAAVICGNEGIGFICLHFWLLKYSPKLELCTVKVTKEIQVLFTPQRTLSLPLIVSSVWSQNKKKIKKSQLKFSSQSFYNTLRMFGRARTWFGKGIAAQDLVAVFISIYLYSRNKTYNCFLPTNLPEI